MREGSAPNFCPRVEEGIVMVLEDDNGERLEFEFLGLILHGQRRYGFFFPLTDDEPVGSSGEVVLLEVTELDDAEVYADFRDATKDLYDFSD